jgi:Flp pilus assembly protein TadG
MKGKYNALTIKRKNLQRGAELVELALTLSFFLVIFFFIVEGVRLIYSFTSITYLASDAVRYSIVRGAEAAADDPDDHRSDVPATASSIREYLRNNKLISLQDQNIVVNYVDGNNNPGSKIQITINYPFVPASQIFERFVGDKFIIPATCEGVIVY